MTGDQADEDDALKFEADVRRAVDELLLAALGTAAWMTGTCVIAGYFLARAS